MTASDGQGAEFIGGLRPAPRLVFGYPPARLASWALFGLAGALAAVFVIHVAKFEAAAPARQTPAASAPVSDQMVVTHSTLTGFDKARQPYTLSAGSAVQDTAEPNLVHLKDVAGELRRRSGDTLGMAAASALFDRKAEMLQLERDVTLVAAGRFVAEMAKAAVTLSDKRLRSDSPVRVTFDRGEITAGGLEITEEGNRVVFFNRARMTFGPQTKDDRLQ